MKFQLDIIGILIRIKMKEILAYLQAKHNHQNTGVSLLTIKEKFPGKDVVTILEQLLKEGIIFEPNPNLFRWLG